MRKFRILASILVVMLLVGSAVSCDNRSQMEKDADKAMKKLGQ